MKPSKNVWINGSTIEREYAKSILADVLKSKWKRVHIDAHVGIHTHCCMCDIPMNVHLGIHAFTDGKFWLCDACWARFIHFSDTL